jgi:hypothetical protein
MQGMGTGRAVSQVGGAKPPKKKIGSEGGEVAESAISAAADIIGQLLERDNGFRPMQRNRRQVTGLKNRI